MIRIIKKYFRELLDLHKKILFWPINQFLSNSNPYIAILAANTLLLLQRKNLIIQFDNNLRIFSIKDKKNYRHFFGHLVRGFLLYKNGILNRSKSLYDSYMLNRINFFKDDIVVDCGANYADLWLSLKDKIFQHNYICFEPGEKEFESIKKNALNSKINNMALSNKDGVFDFYVDENQADSSLFEPWKFSYKTKVKTITLTKYVQLNNIKKIKFFKVEAEGFEPEVLEGARDVFEIIEYIGVDVGYERGRNQEHTLSECTNILLDNNFFVLDANLKVPKVLYRNKKFVDNKIS